MRKRTFYIGLVLIFGCLMGCNHMDEDDEVALRTVPVTNNPHVVPSHGGGFPGVPSGER